MKVTSTDQTGATALRQMGSDLSTITCPHIGNVGVNPDSMEAGEPTLRGLLVRDYSYSPSRGGFAPFA